MSALFAQTAIIKSCFLDITSLQISIYGEYASRNLIAFSLTRIVELARILTPTISHTTLPSSPAYTLIDIGEDPRLLYYGIQYLTSGKYLFFRDDERSPEALGDHAGVQNPNKKS
jgi:hypothetical protein